jgi:hypothetical protein
MVDMEPASTPAVLAPLPGALEGGLPALPPLRSAEIRAMPSLPRGALLSLHVTKKSNAG